MGFKDRAFSYFTVCFFIVSFLSTVYSFDQEVELTSENKNFSNFFNIAQTDKNNPTELNNNQSFFFEPMSPDLQHEKSNCTAPTIQDFPPDMFTQQQRQHGGVVIHFILAIYAMMMIGVVVDEYFVPSLEIVAQVLNMSPDVAGATIMAIGTSSPELFINVVGTFITQGDIGVGTIVGSAVFNILAAPAYCGLVTGFVVVLDWWPITRDCIIYGTVVIGLTIILSDGAIFWWEALILVLSYGLFILIMCFNDQLENQAKRLVAKVRGCFNKGSNEADSRENIQSSSTTVDTIKPTIILELPTKVNPNGIKDLVQIEKGSPTVNVPAVDDEEEDGPVEMFKWPTGTWSEKLYWYIMWPGNMVFFLTVPDVRRGGRWRSSYPFAFFVCIVWIGTLTYMVTWFITVIGYTIGVPDSAMGITFLAAGGSVPEAVATVVVARQGKGTMGISSSVGSNTFDIMICMGLPWLIKAAVWPAYPAEGNFVAINSGGVVYSVLMLFCTVLILYFSLAFNKFRLDRKVGGFLLLCYMIFLALAAMFELNVFLPVNAPPCPE